MKLAELDSELEKNLLSGFWKTRVPLHCAEAPYLWRWESLLDGMLKASETIGIEQAERRAIRLVSPHLPIKSTSHTLQFTFSIVNPGEVARGHRHNMAAIRFVIQGEGAYTTVAGEKFPMEEGDLILTPSLAVCLNLNCEIRDEPGQVVACADRNLGRASDHQLRAPVVTCRLLVNEDFFH